MKLKDKLGLVLGIMILIVFIGTFAGLSDKTIDSIVEWVGSILVGIIVGAISGLLVERFTGDRLKSIFLVGSIGSLQFSVSWFTIATIFVKMFLLS